MDAHVDIRKEEHEGRGRYVLEMPGAKRPI